jgi:predicted nucleotidyltransferase
VGELRARAGEIPYLVGFLVFGSYATGCVGPESDLDVFAITRDPEPSRSERYLAILRHLDFHVPYDLIVYDVAEYEELSTTWPFVAQARTEGIWIDAAASG